MAVNDGQDVVEIVRHAAGQLPDGFHLLRLAQLLLQMLPLRDVHHDPTHLNRHPRSIQGQFRALANDPLLAVGQDNPVFGVVSAPVPEGLVRGLAHTLAVLRMDEPEKEVGGHGALLRFKPEDAVGLIRPAQFVVMDVFQILQIQFPASHVNDPLRGCQAGFAFPQRLRRLFAFGHIARIQNHARDLRILQPVLANRFEITPRAVAMAEAELVREPHVRMLEALFKRPQRGRQILRVHHLESIQANQLLRFVTEHRRQGGAVEPERPVATQNGQHVQRILGQSAKVFFPAGQFGFHPPALGALLRFEHRAAHCGNQPLDPGLEHVIRRAALQAFDGRLFANRARHQQKGSIRTLLPRGLQGLKSVAGGQ